MKIRGGSRPVIGGTVYGNVPFEDVMNVELIDASLLPVGDVVEGKG